MCAAVNILAPGAKVAVMDGFDGNIKIKKTRLHILAAADGGSALDQNSVVKMAKLPANAVIIDIHTKWEAGGGTNTFTIRQTKASDGTTHQDLKTSLTGGSAGYHRLSDETAAAATLLVAYGYESWIELEFTGANGWPVDKYVDMAVMYFTPTFDDENPDNAALIKITGT